MSISINRDGHPFQIISQEELDTIPGKKTVEMTVEGGKTYFLVTIDPSQIAQEELEMLSQLVGDFFSQAHLYYAVPFSPAQEALVHGDFSLFNHYLEGLWVRMDTIDPNLPPETIASFDEAIQYLANEGKLLPMIKARQQEIEYKKEQARPLVALEAHNPDVAHLHRILNSSYRLAVIGTGQSGALWLEDAQGKRFAIVKAVGEDPFELNHRGQYASPLPRDALLGAAETVPPLSIAHQEVLGYQLALLAGLEHVVPKTTLSIIKSEVFNDFMDSYEGVSEEIFTELRGSKEKLVSIQEMVQTALPLSEAAIIASMHDQVLTVDQSELEDVCLFHWIIADLDSNPDNFILYTRADGMRGIKKIDNGQICGEQNKGEVTDYLSSFFKTQMGHPLSDRLRNKLFSLPIAEMQEKMKFFGRSQAASEALKERIEYLQAKVLNSPSITLTNIYKLLRT